MLWYQIGTSLSEKRTDRGKTLILFTDEINWQKQIEGLAYL